MSMKLFRIFVLLIAAGFLSSCYETDRPLINRGQKVPIAGDFACVEAIKGGIETTSLKEKFDGSQSADYTYIDKSGNEFRFLSVRGNLHLVQFKGSDNRYSFFYIDFKGPGRFWHLVPGGPGNSAKITQLAESNNVQLTSPPGELIKVTGSDDDSLNFLRSHESSVLTSVAECKSTSNSKQMTDAYYEFARKIALDQYQTDPSLGIQKGDKISDVYAKFGEPESVENMISANFGFIEYFVDEYILWMNFDGSVNQVGVSLHWDNLPTEPNSLVSTLYRPRLAIGIGIGSTGEELLEVFSNPISSSPGNCGPVSEVLEEVEFGFVDYDDYGFEIYCGQVVGIYRNL